MKTIWKFPLILDDHQTIDIPEGYEPLSIIVQRNIPCLYCLVDPDAPKTRAFIRIAGTGHPIDHQFPGLYLGSFVLAAGDLVFHVFLNGAQP